MTLHGAPRRSVRNHRRSRTGRSTAAAARRRAQCPSRGAERGAAPGRHPRGRAVAGAGRRRHRQDPRADHPHRSPFDHRPRPHLADSCSHLHQQGGARNARPRRQPHRRRGRRHVAGHVPRHRRARAAPPCRVGGAEEQFHHPRHRRPDAADQAAAAGRGHRRQEMAGPHTLRHHPALEGPRAHPRQGVGRRCRRVRQRQGGRDLSPVPGAAGRGERRRFRRPGDALRHPVAEPSRRAGAVPSPLPPHPGRRVPGHQRGAVPVAEAAGAGHAGRLLRRRRRPVDLRLARRRGRQHPALREGFPGRHHRAAGTQLPLDAAYPGRRLAPDLAQRGPPGENPVDGYEGGRAHFPARRVGRRRGGAHGRRGDRGVAARQACARPDRHPGARRLPDPRVRGTVHHHGPALPGDRRAALLRAPGNPRRDGLLPRHRAARRRPRLRAHLQHAAPRPGRIGTAHAAHHPARAEGVAVRGDAPGAGDRRAEGPPAQVAGRPHQGTSTAGAPCSTA